MNQLIIPTYIFDQMLSHCREWYPNEACGILAGKDGSVEEIYRLTNVEASPVSYMMDPAEQFRAMKEMRARGLSQVAIFHSHPSSPAYPSAKDVGLAFYDDAVYIIVSLADGEEVVRGFSIREGMISEVAIVKGFNSPSRKGDEGGCST